LVECTRHRVSSAAERALRRARFATGRTDTRHRTHDVALEVFSEGGEEGATLREIADRLGITRPDRHHV
jgi:AcrR family transcriptional regulator